MVRHYTEENRRISLNRIVGVKLASRETVGFTHDDAIARVGLAIETLDDGDVKEELVETGGDLELDVQTDNFQEYPMESYWLFGDVEIGLGGSARRCEAIPSRTSPINLEPI